ncbi:hypothetical protein [Pseudomonas moraviensis]|uniref:DNA gyrase/topoisomerase IV subunit A n=1 Tax=Pseudomonas moraviensis TaxID=321662 RepID=A0A7Y9W111_9PSED|nr:hypothetical protein [Pseudomonas moraviensis]NYH12194.1 DNA gyrase/topoisomerase IV subunit A [Pseudomonas moraviensis]
MLDEFTTTIKAQLYERVSSPLLSSFIFSWCGWNYKFLLVILSSISAHEKLTYIELNIFPTLNSKITYGALLPLLTSLFLIFIYPIPAEFIYRHVKTNQRRLKEIQQSIDDESPLSKEQARKIRREALENQLKYESEIDSKTSENSRLKELISELQQKIIKLEEPLETVDKNASGDISSTTSPTETPAEAEAAKQQLDKPPLKSMESNIDHILSNKGLFKTISASELDSIMRVSISNYIQDLNSFSNLEFDVIANKGKLAILLMRSDGSYFPYISAEYTPSTAFSVLESLKSALSNDKPPTKGE